jgi:hypothetical protein
MNQGLSPARSAPFGATVSAITATSANGQSDRSRDKPPLPSFINIGAGMTFLDEQQWQGRIFDGSWRTADGGERTAVEPATGDELGAAAADLEAYIDTCWITSRTSVPDNRH